MPTWYVKSGAGAADYNAAHAYSLTEKFVPSLADVTANVAIGRRAVWEVTTAGTTNGAITWPAAVTYDTTTITQNGMVATARKPGFSSGTTANWAFATIYSNSLYVNAATGDTVYISNNHAESNASTSSCQTAGVLYQCVDDSAAPPTAAATTASVASSVALAVGASNSSINGVTFIAGSGGSANLNLTPTGQFKNCSLQLGSTGTASRIAGPGASAFESINCSVKFAAAAQGINNSNMVAYGLSLAAGGTSPTALLLQSTGSNVRINSLDLTNASAGINIAASSGSGTVINVFNVRTPASWSGTVDSSTPVIPGYSLMTNGDNAGTDYIIQRKDQFGTLTQETSITRTGGASNGTTALSWKIVSIAGAGAFPWKYTQSPEIVKWFPITGFAAGNPVTITIHFIRDSVTGLTDAEIWFEVMYLATAGAPLGTLGSCAAASIFATPNTWAADSATWVNTGGMSNPNKQKMTLQITPALAGIMHIAVKVCKATTTVYVDPQIDFS